MKILLTNDDGIHAPGLFALHETQKKPGFAFAARFSRNVVRFLAEGDLKDGIALNVNIPPVSPEEISGVCLARQGTSRFEERFERRRDPRGNVYYWLSGETFIENGNPDNDSAVLKQNKITITPIHYDLTAEGKLTRLKATGMLHKLGELLPKKDQT